MLTEHEKRMYCKARGYSQRYASYWISHPGCEANCGAPSEAPHHIRTRGAGGPDEAWNMLGLCVLHHRMIHNVGDLRFAEMYPRLSEKIAAAKKHPLDKRTKV